MNQIFLETRMFRLSDGEEIMTLAFFVLIQYRSVTDGQTDGHLFSGYTSACIARYANALVKTQEPKRDQLQTAMQLSIAPVLWGPMGQVGNIVRLDKAHVKSTDLM